MKSAKEKVEVYFMVFLLIFERLFEPVFGFLRRHLGWIVVIILVGILVMMPEKDKTDVVKDVAIVQASVGIGEFAPITEEREKEVASYLQKARAAIMQARKFLSASIDKSAVVVSHNKSYEYLLDFVRNNKYDKSFDKALKEYGFLIEAEIGRYPGTKITKNLVAAMIAHESRCDPDIIGRDGELGLMQILPKTAAHFGYTNKEDVKDPAINIHIGVMYLAQLEKNMGSLPKALSGYNRGEEGAKDKIATNPDYALTYDYVESVRAILEISGEDKSILL